MLSKDTYEKMTSCFTHLSLGVRFITRASLKNPAVFSLLLFAFILSTASDCTCPIVFHPHILFWSLFFIFYLKNLNTFLPLVFATVQIIQRSARHTLLAGHL